MNRETEGKGGERKEKTQTVGQKHLKRQKDKKNKEKSEKHGMLNTDTKETKKRKQTDKQTNTTNNSVLTFGSAGLLSTAACGFLMSS